MKLFLLLMTLWLPWQSAIAGERILALAPHICEILYAIGAEAEIVGAVDYCDYPQAAEALPRVGGYHRINVEAAIALKPTLALVLDEQAQGVSKLRELGVRVVSIYPKNVDEVLAGIRYAGALTGHDQQADRLADRLQIRLQRLQSRVSGQAIPTFYEIWADPLMTAGKRTFITDVLRRIGLRNVFGSVEMEAPRINVESVISAGPKVVVVPSEKRDVSERTIFWKKWLGEDIRVITVNHNLVHRPGPRLLDGMEYLVEQLQGSHP